MKDLSAPDSGERIPCFYDLKLGIQSCRLDGRNWSWPFAAMWIGSVDPTWVRLRGRPE